MRKRDTFILGRLSKPVPPLPGNAALPPVAYPVRELPRQRRHNPSAAQGIDKLAVIVHADLFITLRDNGQTQNVTSGNDRITRQSPHTKNKGKSIPTGAKMSENKKQLADEVAPRLRAALRAIDKNQTQIADFLDVGPNRINQFCKGKRLADLQLMMRICDQYGLTLDWFYRGDPAGVRASIAEDLVEAYHNELNQPSHPHKSSRSAKKKTRHAA